MSWIVFTDLDGTLLDHDSYSFDAASDSLCLLKDKKIPVVIVTSKTFAEVDELRSSLDLDYPFIVENGAAIYFPKSTLTSTLGYPWLELEGDLVSKDDYMIYPLGPKYAYWQSISKSVIERFGKACTPFSYLTTEQISELTGLSTPAAIKAQQREFSDPIYWFGSNELYRSFQQTMESQGLKVVRGGRFVHLLKGTNKGLAVQWFIKFYSSLTTDKPNVMVLGDGDNDISMLELADTPVLIRSKSHGYPNLASTAAYRTSHYGPAGWSEAIQKFIA
ncbi:HAD-IIB family hydrolase [Reinekea sp.]|jgi:mannosyl-3-phosphoglycerate phosphatase|uniref:HAD-IIB family hydrolase n=1 Tax=Reinekea sp. TaxID=1970455 RepID=UPI00398A342F